MKKPMLTAISTGNLEKYLQGDYITGGEKMPEEYLKTVFDMEKFKPGTAVKVSDGEYSTFGFIAESTPDKLHVKAFVNDNHVLLSCWITVSDAIEKDLRIKIL